MDPVKFPQCNARYGPPEGLVESQVRTIHAYEGTVERGSCEGCKMVVVAHKPTPEDIARIVAGEPIFITQIGGLAPHFLTTSFEEANNCA